MSKNLSFAACAFAVAALTSCGGQKKVAQPDIKTGGAADTLVVMSYNIENFFDPEDNPDKNDDDFTPDGSYHWTVTRMKDKAAKLARDNIRQQLARAGHCGSV